MSNTYDVYYTVIIEVNEKEKEYKYVREVLHIKCKEEIDNDEVEDVIERIIKYKFEKEKVIDTFIDLNV